MAESFLIYPKQRDKFDASLNQKVVAFFNKLTTNDETPGLHVEPIVGAADPRARTGRIDQQYRALLFKMTGGGTTAYVVHGIYNHDEAYRKAQQVTLTMNPVNGLPSFQEVASTAAATPKPSEPVQPVVQELQPVIAFGAEDLIVVLGLPPEAAETAAALTSKEAVSHFAQSLPEWQGLALLLLAEGEPITTVAQELQLLRADEDVTMGIEEARAAFAEPAAVTDQELLDSFDRPAAQMTFAKVKGEEELRRVITEGDFGSWRIFLHPQQRQWVQRDWNGPYRISGGAGTGKTVVLVHRARRLANADPEASMVLTTFTTNLADELGRSLRRLDPSVKQTAELGSSGVLVRGIDSLASAVLKSAGEDVGEAVAQVLGAGRTDIGARTDASVWDQALLVAADLPPHLQRRAFLQAEYEMIVLPNRITQLQDYLKIPRPGRGIRLARAARKAVWAVIEQYRSLARQAGSIDFAEAATIAAAHLDLQGTRPARYVLVDEGQDFKPCHWQLVRALAAEQGNDIFIAEDAHQRIYGQKLVLSQYQVRTQGRSRGLRLNYRTTAENLAWAVGVLQGQPVIDSEGERDSMAGYLSARSGPTPRLVECSNLSAELDFAAKQVEEWVAAGDVAPETIAVLVRDRTGRDRVARGLGERGVEVRVLEIGSVKPGAPVALTMHRAKGTEFTKVLLFGLSQDSIPMGLKAYDYDEQELEEAKLRERSLLYVAASRARDELVATYSGKPSVLLPDQV